MKVVADVLDNINEGVSNLAEGVESIAEGVGNNFRLDQKLEWINVCYSLQRMVRVYRVITHLYCA